jgi:RNA 3'-terminal phosphate cyclase (ATP)
MSEVVTIDGSLGEGGGQILRTALSLSAVLGLPVTICNIRAGRPKPGLRSQHLAAARAAARVCSGELEGAGKGSMEISLRPGPVSPGNYEFGTGTAGSATLVFQTLLPVLACAEEPSTLALSGGTHNPMAPPADFIVESYLPSLRRMGLRASCDLVRHGFYPRGGGELHCAVEPRRRTPAPVLIEGEVDWRPVKADILLADLPAHVAEREMSVLSRELDLLPERIMIAHLPGELGPANVVMVRLSAAGRTAVLTAFGERGKRAEIVAREAAAEARALMASGAPVEPRLADQLLLPMALGAGGTFATSAVTGHTRTSIELIRLIAGLEIAVEKVRDDFWIVRVPGRGVEAGLQPRDSS